MEITEEQRKRSEANRLAALAKLNRAAEATKQDVWKLFKCQKVSPERDAASPPPKMENPQAVRFRVVLEICAPDAFSITPQPVKDSPFPGRDECLQMIDQPISVLDLVELPSSSSSSHVSVKGGKNVPFLVFVCFFLLLLLSLLSSFVAFVWICSEDYNGLCSCNGEEGIPNLGQG